MNNPTLQDEILKHIKAQKDRLKNIPNDEILEALSEAQEMLEIAQQDLQELQDEADARELDYDI